MECIFCDFINGKRENHSKKFSRLKEKYPLIPIFETKEVFSFLSLPDNNNETHVLIIPKKHYEFIEDVPQNELNTLSNSVAKSCGILRKKYSGCRIQVNNGKSAEQWIRHVHFHLIPTKEDKNFAWKNLSSDEFIILSNNLKTLFKKI